MRNSYTKIKSNMWQILLTIFLASTLVTANIAFGQKQNDEPIRRLQSGQTLEREMTGAQTHLYRFDLQTNEFFQVQTEQKGVDVELKLLNASNEPLVTMNSPNGKQGVEILSYVAGKSGNFVLEVSNTDAKIEKGKYTIRREASRKATARDKRRVEIESIFVEAVKALKTVGQTETATKKLREALSGWQELADQDLIGLTERQLKAQEVMEEFKAFSLKQNETHKVFNEAHNLKLQSKAESVLQARAKFNEARNSYRDLLKACNDVFEKLAAVRQELNMTAEQVDENKQTFQGVLKAGEKNALTSICHTHLFWGEFEKGLEYAKQALAAIRELRSGKSKYAAELMHKMDEASTLSSLIALILQELNRHQESIDYRQQGVQLFRELQNDIPGLQKELQTAQIQNASSPYLNPIFQEGMILTSIAQSYIRLEERRKAIEAFETSIAVLQKLSDEDSLKMKAEAFSQAGLEYRNLFELEMALSYYDKSLNIYRKLQDKNGQASALGLKANVYILLGDEKSTREYVQQSLDLLLQLAPDSSDNYLIMPNLKGQQEFLRLSQLGNLYRVLGETGKAIEYYEKSLSFARSSKDFYRLPMSTIGDIYSSIGDVYFSEIKDKTKALENFQKALEFSRQSTDKRSIAFHLRSLGGWYWDAGNPQEALRHFNEAFALYQSIGIDGKTVFSEHYATTLSWLARTQADLGNRRLAIFYGKLCVNASQQERQRLRNFDQELQKRYLRKNEKPYRGLAERLIAENRLPEAEQVLQMLKEDEYFRYIRRGDDKDNEKLAQRADLNSDEEAALKRYNEISSRLAAMGMEYGKLEEKKRRLPEGVALPPDEEKRVADLAKAIEEASTGFQAFLKQLAAEFATTPKATQVINETQHSAGLGADLKDWREKFGDKGVVALYTVLGDDRYRVILTTPDVQTDGKSEIKAEDLRQKIAAFRQIVQTPELDPRPLGKELYDILIKPIEKQLDDADAKILLWSLDDMLRYLPIAALWDGRQYVGEKYQNVIITLASRTRLGDTSSPGWRVLGLGVSEAKQVSWKEPNGKVHLIDFHALPGARAELQSIIHDETSQQTETGILPGRRLLDATFTEAALKDRLGRGYHAVHIASHFSFRPGDLTRSFLLLGDGQALTLNKIKTSPQLAFTGVELLTLSACETAIGEANADGVEIESFGVIAQDRGAKAVLATLWRVEDESTRLLMSEFYRLRKANPKLTKTEAMKLAQHAMITGRLHTTVEGERGAKVIRAIAAQSTAPRFPFDATKPFAHPFYWSAFVLIGNWR